MDSITVKIAKNLEVVELQLFNQCLKYALCLAGLHWGVVSLHAAVVRLRWGVAAIIGQSMAGKSTLAISAALRGATLLTDDRVFLDSNMPHCTYSLGEPVTFRPGSSDLLPAWLEFDLPSYAIDPIARRNYKVPIDCTATGIERVYALGPLTAFVVLTRAVRGMAWQPLRFEDVIRSVREADPWIRWANDGLHGIRRTPMNGKGWTLGRNMEGANDLDKTTRLLIERPPDIEAVPSTNHG